MDTLEDINTLAATATYLKVSETLIADMARNKRIGALKIGRQWVFPRSVITAFVESKTQEAKAPVNPWNRSSTSQKRGPQRAARAA